MYGTLRMIKNLLPATTLWQGNVHTPFCHSVHRGVSALTPRQTPPSGQTPPAQTPPSLGRHPLPGQTRPPWADTPLLGRHRPPWTDTPFPVHSGIWSTSERYASYCNTFLLIIYSDTGCIPISLSICIALPLLIVWSIFVVSVNMFDVRANKIFFVPVVKSITSQILYLTYRQCTK